MREFLDESHCGKSATLSSFHRLSRTDVTEVRENLRHAEAAKIAPLPRTSLDKLAECLFEELDLLEGYGGRELKCDRDRSIGRTRHVDNLTGGSRYS
jgi:hypothetical protein